MRSLSESLWAKFADVGSILRVDSLVRLRICPVVEDLLAEPTGDSLSDTLNAVSVDDDMPFDVNSSWEFFEAYRTRVVPFRVILLGFLSGSGAVHFEGV